MTLKLGMQHRVLKYYQIPSNDSPGLTLTYFTAMSNLVPYAFVWEKGKTMDFSETIVVYDLKLATHDQSDKKFPLTSKLCPLGALLRGYIHVLNHEKKKKRHIATLYCDVPTEKVIFKGEQMHVRIWSNGPSTSLVCICRHCFFFFYLYVFSGGKLWLNTCTVCHV